MKIRVISDFNAELFGRYLGQAIAPAPQVQVTPFAQLYQSLDSPPDAAAAAIVWTRAEGAIAFFRRAVEFEDVAHDEVLAEVDQFADIVARFAAGMRTVLLASWITPPGSRGYGPIDLRPGTGIANLVARMNLRLAERLSAAPNVYILDAERWIRAAGARAGSPKMWYAGKVPYGNPVFEEAALDVSAALEGLAGRSRRLIVLDLDNTLWGGVVGEAGWQGLSLGGHDIVGEAYADFQRALRALSRRGIQLAVVSKNDESVAMEAIDRHPEMLLRRGDLAGWKINWDDKAANIAALAGELNLGLASVVFIDDSPIERARVRETFPEILVPEWPSDPAQFRATLESLRCFDAGVLSAEDRTRGQMYVAERERKATLDRVGSLDDWLKTLEIKVFAAPLGPGNAKRAVQLLNKTNQLNLATRRMTEAELMSWLSSPERRLWTVTVSDRFGDSGLTGIVSVQLDGRTARLADFLLSCRVMGRRVEETMLYLAESFARERGAAELLAELIPTERNRPCLEFFEKSGMSRVSEFLFSRRLDSEPRPPDCVLLSAAEEAAV